MSFAFPLEVGVDIVLSPEEAASTAAFALAFALGDVSPEVMAELPYWFVREPPPDTLGMAIGSVNVVSCFWLCHAGDIRPPYCLLSVI